MAKQTQNGLKIDKTKWILELKINWIKLKNWKFSCQCKHYKKTKSHQNQRVQQFPVNVLHALHITLGQQLVTVLMRLLVNLGHVVVTQLPHITQPICWSVTTPVTKYMLGEKFGQIRSKSNKYINLARLKPESTHKIDISSSYIEGLHQNVVMIHFGGNSYPQCCQLVSEINWINVFISNTVLSLSSAHALISAHPRFFFKNSTSSTY